MKNITLFLMIALSAGLIGYGGDTQADDATIVTMAMNSPPIFFKDDQGQWQGFALELNNLLVATAGYRPVYIELPWNRGLAYLKSGEVELMGYLSRTPGREAYIHFLGVSAYEQACIVMRREDANIKLDTLDDLSQDGYLWGLRDNAFYAVALSERLMTDPEFGKHFEYEATVEITLKKVMAGRTKGCFRDCLAAAHAVRINPDFRNLIVRTAPFLPPSPIYFGVSRKMPMEKRKKLQRAYDQLNQQGAFQQIAKKWME